MKKTMNEEVSAMEDKKSKQLTWSPNEAAAAMGISDARFRKLILETDDLPAFRLGASFIRIPIEPFIEWVNELGRKRYGLPERPASKTFDLIMGKRREREA